MNRRDILKKAGLLSAAALTGKNLLATTTVPASPDAGTAPGSTRRKRVLRVAHITDVHIRPESENKAMSRFRRCLEHVRAQKPDLILNGGDSVFAVDYDNITKDRVLELWKCWHDSIVLVKDIPMYSVLGNHDMWWQGKGDELFGKPGALKMLGLTNNYYSFDSHGWHFILLDSNHPHTAGMLDDEQWQWFVQDVEKNKDKPTLLLSHYPLLSCTGIVDNKTDKLGPFTVSGGYTHLDIMKFVGVFKQHPNIRLCLSGHIHLQDKVWYNNVQYLCNGAVSGYWWGSGDDGHGSYKDTRPGYSLLNLYNDGHFDEEYIHYEETPS